MGKVKLTQEQADAIEGIKEYQRKLLNSGEHRIMEEFKDLRSLTTDEFMDALYVGYEVEPEFKVGDWAYNKQTNRVFQVIDGLSENMNNEANREHLRHATPEEISKEKERRWWAKHGRGVWEIKQGDVLMGTHRELYEVTADPKSHRYGCYTGNDSRDFDIEECKRDNWRVVCFADDREDLK